MTASSQIPGALPPEQPPVVSELRLRAVTTVPASPDVPDRLVVDAPEPQLPACLACGTSTGPLCPDSRGRRYPSGAQVLYCAPHVPDSGPVRAAVGVITAVMEDGTATARDIAVAEESAGILVDPGLAQELMKSAREQARAEMAAELTAVRDELDQARETIATQQHFKTRLDGIRAVLAGRPDSDLMFVREILAAADGGPASVAPMTLTWSGTVDVPTADADPQRAIVDCVTPYGGRAALVVQGAERLALASLIESEVRDVHAECNTVGCGAQAMPQDEVDASVWGWSILQVAGTSEPGRWYCSSMCVVDALARAGAELAEQDERAAGGEL